MQCVTECSATKVGRKGAALQKFFYEGDDTIWTRLTAKNNVVAGDPNDYRFTIRFDKAGFDFFRFRQRPSADKVDVHIFGRPERAYVRSKFSETLN